MPAFATVADLATYMQQDFSAADSATAAQALDLTTAAIKGYTGQAIEAVTGDIARLPGAAGRRLWLPELPVTAVGPVTVIAAFGTAATVAASDYTWRRSGLVLARHAGLWGGPDAEVVITYAHGTSPVPDDVRAVCLAAAARMMSNPAAQRSLSIGSYTEGFAQADGGGLLSADERAQLDYYRLPVLA